MADEASPPAAGDEPVVYSPREALEAINAHIGEMFQQDREPLGVVLTAILRNVRSEHAEQEDGKPANAAERARALRDKMLTALEQVVQLVEGDPLFGPKPELPGNVRAIADAAHSLDGISYSAGAVAMPIEPDALKAAAAQLTRAAEALGNAKDVQGRFAPADEPEPEMASPSWARVRVLPEGFEDLDPEAMVRHARVLEAAAQ